MLVCVYTATIISHRVQSIGLKMLKVNVIIRLSFIILSNLAIVVSIACSRVAAVKKELLLVQVSGHYFHHVCERLQLLLPIGNNNCKFIQSTRFCAQAHPHPHPNHTHTQPTPTPKPHPHPTHTHTHTHILHTHTHTSQQYLAEF